IRRDADADLPVTPARGRLLAHPSLPDGVRLPRGRRLLEAAQRRQVRLVRGEQVSGAVEGERDLPLLAFGLRQNLAQEAVGAHLRLQVPDRLAVAYQRTAELLLESQGRPGFRRPLLLRRGPPRLDLGPYPVLHDLQDILATLAQVVVQLLLDPPGLLGRKKRRGHLDHRLQLRVLRELADDARQGDDDRLPVRGRPWS